MGPGQQVPGLVKRVGEASRARLTGPLEPGPHCLEQGSGKAPGPHPCAARALSPDSVARGHPTTRPTALPSPCLSV